MDSRIEALEQAWGGVKALLAEVGPEEWALPTPCTDWSVRDLAGHLAAVESQFQGLAQPAAEPPDPTAGIDAWTAVGITARKDWSVDEVLAEIEAASSAQLGHLRSLGDDGWSAERFGPTGPTTEEGLAKIRCFDIYTHLLDLRFALGRALAVDGEPDAAALCADWAFEVTPWGAVKKAGLGDGARVHIDVTGPGGRATDLVVEGKRARVEEPSSDTEESVTGTAAAYFLLGAGREEMAAAAGGVKANGANAELLVERFRMFT